MRHGEATDNVRGIISDKEEYGSHLTRLGIAQVVESASKLPQDIVRIYVSPLPRTIETSHYVQNKLTNAELLIDNRIREIGYGKYSGQQNNAEIDHIREQQKSGDYFVRFGDYGENKYEIELRLTKFLIDAGDHNFGTTIIVISHGSIISYMKRILQLKSPHINMGEFERFDNIDCELASRHLKN